MDDYTDEWIIRHYHYCADKRAQIDIFQQLTGRPKEDIISLLKLAGEEIPTTRGAGRPAFSDDLWRKAVSLRLQGYDSAAAGAMTGISARLIKERWRTKAKELGFDISASHVIPGKNYEKKVLNMAKESLCANDVMRDFTYFLDKYRNTQFKMENTDGAVTIICTIPIEEETT